MSVLASQSKAALQPESLVGLASAASSLTFRARDTGAAAAG